MSFFKVPEIREILKPLRPKLARSIPHKIQIEPRSNRYMLVGTAFDYLLRFDLQRRAPHARSERWVAEHAPEMLWRKTETGNTGLFLDWMNEEDTYATNEELSSRAQAIIDNAHQALNGYTQLVTPSTRDFEEMAGHAIRMAKLDALPRSLRLSPDFEQASTEDIADLVSMLEIVPFEELVDANRILLNPVFNGASELVGGADADLITGDMIVDIKTTKKDVVEAEQLDQILGYFLLARKQRAIDPSFPQINRVGLYYSRHGFLLSLPVTHWTSDPRFLAVEEQFFSTAARLFPQGKPVLTVPQ